MSSFFSNLARGWNGLWDLVRLTRFNFILLVAAVLILFVPDQGRELALSSGDIGNSSTIIWFILAVCWWAIQSWYWARLTFELEFSRDRTAWSDEHGTERFGKRGFWIANLPRLYALGVFALGVAFLWLGKNEEARTLAIVAAVFIVLLIVRVPLMKVLGLYQRAGELDAGDAAERYKRFRTVLPPLSILFLRFSIAVAVILAILAISMPVHFGSRLGAPAIAFLSFGGFIPIGSYVLLWAQRHQDLPILTMILIAVAIFSPFNDNHMVRPHEAADDDMWVSKDELDSHRLSLATAVHRWLEVRDKVPAPSATASAPVPMVFVSTAGGGMPAAYWTTTVLGRLQDELRRNADLSASDRVFSNHVFSISGVSGGSVGAAIYMSLLKDPDLKADLSTCRDEIVSKHELGKTVYKLRSNDTVVRGQAILCSDLLGPAVAALLFQDVLQQFVPFGVVHLKHDRGYAIERAMEMGWERVHACAKTDDLSCKDDNPLRSEFLKLWCDAGDDACWQDRGWSPLLMLNGTHQETGKRVITSKLAVTNNVFTDSYDFFELSNYHVALSTAAHNSARFPVISPAGGLWTHDQDGPEEKKFFGMISSKTRRGHVLDGGYFENNGTETTKDLALRVFDIAQFGDQATDMPGFWVKPIFIEIVNNADASEEELARRFDDTGSCLDQETSASFNEKLDPYACYKFGKPCSESKLQDLNPVFNELRAPLDGIFSTRSARGTQSAKNLVEQACRTQKSSSNVASPVFAQFRICRKSPTEKPGLGWRLSADSRQLMKYHLVDKDATHKRDMEVQIKSMGEKVPEGVSEQKAVDEFVECMQANEEAHRRVMEALEHTLNWDKLYGGQL